MLVVVLHIYTLKPNLKEHNTKICKILFDKKGTAI